MKSPIVYSNSQIPRVLVAIPCLNEESAIASVIDGVKAANSDYTILVVDDGSSDSTPQIAHEKNTVVISHERNHGLGAAFQTAQNYALSNFFDVLVVIDGDGQFDPSEIPTMLIQLSDGRFNIVVGTRFAISYKHENMSTVKSVGNWLFAKVMGIFLPWQTSDSACGFRAYDRESLLKISIQRAFNFSQDILIQAAYQKLRVTEFPISVSYFEDRRSRVAHNLTTYAINVARTIVKSILELYPVRFFSTLIFLTLTPGIVFGAIFILNFLKTGKFTGYLYAGFLSAFLVGSSLIFILAGLFEIALRNIKGNQNQILYELRKSNFSKHLD